MKNYELLRKIIIPNILTAHIHALPSYKIINFMKYSGINKNFHYFRSQNFQILNNLSTISNFLLHLTACLSPNFSPVPEIETPQPKHNTEVIQIIIITQGIEFALGLQIQNK